MPKPKTRLLKVKLPESTSIQLGMVADRLQQTPESIAAEVLENFITGYLGVQREVQKANHFGTRSVPTGSSGRPIRPHL